MTTWPASAVAPAFLVPSGRRPSPAGGAIRGGLPKSPRITVKHGVGRRDPSEDGATELRRGGEANEPGIAPCPLSIGASGFEKALKKAPLRYRSSVGLSRRKAYPLWRLQHRLDSASVPNETSAQAFGTRAESE